MIYIPDDEEDQLSEDRFITKEEARPNNEWRQQEFACPNCGSYNTGQSTYVDYCNSCGWSQGY